MTKGKSAQSAAAELFTIFAQGRGELDFLGARRSAPQIAQEAERLAEALAARGYTRGRRAALLLPNTPTFLVVVLAASRLGLELLLLDPRADEAALFERLADFKPELLVTSDPAPLFDKVLRLLADCPSEIPLLVERFTDLLPFPRNLLAPLLRGGAIATLPPEARFLRYGDFIRGAEAKGGLSLGEFRPMQLLGGSLEVTALLQKISAAEVPQRFRERWLIAAPLSEPDILARTLRGIEAGAEVILSPRLDRKSLAKITRQTGADREVS